MFPGMNPKKMQQMMKQMGIQQQEIDAEQVIIKCGDKQIIIDSPNVSKVNMMGQQTYQIVGESREESIDTTPEINEEDLQTVIDQTNCSKEKAQEVLEKTKGDIAEAILKLSENSE
jgi:nascent polypeptide-associated complex subunit alpha